jgi:hypothetical protein
MANTSLPFVDVNVDTFDGWILKTNNAINALIFNAVTTSNTTAGDYTYGNGFVQGRFGANTIVTTNIRGGNVQNSSNGNINVLSNTNFTGSRVSVNGYIEVGQALTQIWSTNTVTTGTSQIAIDTFANTAYRTVKYLISVTDNVANNYQSTELMLMQSGGNVFITEYATLVSNNSVAQFSANVDSGSVNLLYTSSSANTTVNINKISVSV